MNQMSQIGSYKILKKLGGGLFATVYLVEDTKKTSKKNNKYALKLFNITSTIPKEKLAREARIQRKLSNERIVKFVDFQDINGLYCLIMEYIDGENLYNKITTKELEFKEILKISWNICCGLEYLHEENLIHNDIKPQNIICQGTDIKIIDFGLSRLLKSTIPTLSIQNGIPFGTLHYMSPEQAYNDPHKYPMDHRTDIYSFGILMYHMITGRVPFDSPHDAVIIDMHKRDTPIPISSYRKNTPQSLEILVNKAIEKKPSDRFSTATAMRRAIEDVAKELNISIIDDIGEPFPRLKTIIAILSFFISLLWAYQETAYEPLLVAAAAIFQVVSLFSNKYKSLKYKSTIDKFLSLITVIFCLFGLYVIISPTIPTEGGTTTLPNLTITTDNLIVNTPTTDTSTASTPTTGTSTASTPTTDNPTSSIPTGVVIGENVNLRTGPSADFDIIGAYKKGTQMEIIGRNDSASWLNVTTPDGKQGWMAATFVERNIDINLLDILETPPLPTKQPTNTVVVIPTNQAKTSTPPPPIQPTTAPVSYDGTWTGTTSAGGTIDFVVSGGRVTNIHFAYPSSLEPTKEGDCSGAGSWFGYESWLNLLRITVGGNGSFNGQNIQISNKDRLLSQFSGTLTAAGTGTGYIREEITFGSCKIVSSFEWSVAK